MGKSPARPSTFAKPGYDTAPAPGTYDDGKRFNSRVKPMTIGRSRSNKLPGPLASWHDTHIQT